MFGLFTMRVASVRRLTCSTTAATTLRAAPSVGL